MSSCHQSYCLHSVGLPCLAVTVFLSTQTLVLFQFQSLYFLLSQGELRNILIQSYHLHLNETWTHLPRVTLVGPGKAETRTRVRPLNSRPFPVDMYCPGLAV